MVPGHPVQPTRSRSHRCDLRMATTGPTAVMPYPCLMSEAPPDRAALSSARYRYKVARLTPRNLAMSLPVCPSAFFRFASGNHPSARKRHTRTTTARQRGSPVDMTHIVARGAVTRYGRGRRWGRSRWTDSGGTVLWVVRHPVEAVQPSSVVNAALPSHRATQSAEYKNRSRCCSPM